MGQACSTTDQNKGPTRTIIQTVISKLGLNFSPSQWEAAHDVGSISGIKESIEDVSQGQPLGCDLQRIDELPTNIHKCVFICCNTYTKPEYSLGVGPMNDSLSVASYLKHVGFQVYFVHNPKSEEFLHYFKHFLRETKEYLVVYYTGHGGHITDGNNDAKDGKDEALIFDDNYIFEHLLSEAIANSGKPDSSKVCLFNDCGHNGIIYNFKQGFFNKIRMPSNIFSLSSIKDLRAANKTSIGGKNQGIFTFYFFKLISQDPSLTPLSIEPKINSFLKKYNQRYICTATSTEILNEIVFQ